MTRILLHPLFLELLSSNSLLDQISRKKLASYSSHGNTYTNDTGPVWLSEDDLCSMWKVVLKAKLYKTKTGYRMENLAWRLWFYARMKNHKESKPVTVTAKAAVRSIGSESPCGLSPKDIPQRAWLSSTNNMVVPEEEELGNSRNSMLTVPSKPRQMSSKSFVVVHEFSLLKLGGTDSSEEDEEEYAEPLDTRILNPNIVQVNRVSVGRRRGSKKKKDVDKYLQQHSDHLFKASEPKSSISTQSITFKHIEADQRSNVIKASPEMKRIGVPARRVSRGFSIPSKKSGSSISAESPRMADSSVSSDDTLGMLDRAMPRTIANLPSATYNGRRPSFSRSASPQSSRTPVSMLTILMNGQLAVPHRHNLHISPPSRPTAPVHFIQEAIAEEVEPAASPAEQNTDSANSQESAHRRTRPRTGKSPGNHRPVQDLHPHLPIW